MKYLFIFLFPLFTFGAVQSPEESARLVVHILSYIAADYPGAVKDGKVLSKFEYDEQGEFAAAALQAGEEVPELKANPEIHNGLLKVRALIAAKGSAEEVSATANRVKETILRMGKFNTAPTRLPDLQKGKVAFAENCASCHGASGNGDGPAGKGLEPPPTDFHSDKMDDVSPFQMFNTIRMGVNGTGMAAFPYSDNDTWDLAFYIASLREKTDNANVLFSKLKLDEVLLDAQGGRWDKAKNSAVLAYLEGIEPLEPQLRANAPALILAVEAKMTEIRNAIGEQADAAHLKILIEQGDELLSQVDKTLTEKPQSFWLTFGVSSGIFLREAFEATLFLITLLGVLQSLKLTTAIRYVHAGWLTAVFVGIASWFLSGWLINLSGADRETLEGAISLFAVGVLLYVGFWLHRRTEIGKWHAFINDLVKAALEKKSLWVLFFAAFVGVFREAFETVLFLRTLMIEGGQGTPVLAGVLSSFVVVVLLSYLALRYSVRIPVRNLFQISSIIMLVLAFILLGKAVHGFQESGLLPITLLPLNVRSDVFGVYPTIESLIPQILLLMASVALLVLGRLRDRKLRSASANVRATE